VIDVNEAPFFTPLDQAEVVLSSGYDMQVQENAANGAAVGAVRCSDYDFTHNGSSTFAFVLSGSGSTAVLGQVDDRALYRIDSTSGAVTVRESTFLGHENATFNSSALTVRCSDPGLPYGGSLWADTDVRVVVTDVAESPVLSSTTLWLYENEPVSTVLRPGRLNATDQDVGETEQLQYSLESGSDVLGIGSGSPVVSVRESTGELYVSRGGVFDKENATSRAGWVIVRATDPSGLFVRANVSIDVRDANEAPFFPVDSSTLYTYFIDENAANGTSVGTPVVATDADASDDGALSYEISRWWIIGGILGGRSSEDNPSNLAELQLSIHPQTAQLSVLLSGSSSVLSYE